VRREYPDAPIAGVGAVIVEGNRVVLVRRGKEPLKGEWSLPGGALELGETLEQGIRREVQEETGLRVEVISVVEVLDRIVADEAAELNGEDARKIRYHYVLIDYLCRVSGGELAASSDAADARWVTREELNGHSIYRLAPITASVIEKAFRIAEGLGI
jgi:8-oxo-dGTP diphosphatase